MASAVIHIWYSLRISEQDFTSLLLALQELADCTELRTLTEEFMDIPDDQLIQLKDVWNTWLRLAQREGSWVTKLRQEANSGDFGREKGINHYIHAIPKEHKNSTRRYFDTGIFTSMKNTKELKRENPTLTGRGFQRFFRNSDFHYSLPTDVLPFTGWDYNAVKKICHDKSITRMYSIYISLVLNKSIEKLRRNRIKCYFILSDFLNVEAFLPADRRYDRITTSNLRDYYPLTVLLTRFKGPLNTTNPYAVMSTEAINWVRNYMPEVIHLLPNMIGLDDLVQKALKDTRNPELANLSGMSAFLEYSNLTQQFAMFLRASLLFPNTDEDLASLKGKKKIPSLKSLVASLGLHLRDFVRCENTVFPFKWALNCRRPTMLRGYERALEWKLLSADEGIEDSKE